MWKLAILAPLLACSPADQESVRTVAAMEVVLRSAADRADLLSILRRRAAADPSLHVDDVSARWRDLAAGAASLPEVDGTIYVGIWRGENDDELEVDANDMGHKGRVWLTFPKGTQPDRSTKLSTGLIGAVRDRWPDAEPLPVLPSGALALSTDLRKTSAGYKVAKSAAGRYGLSPSSPLISLGQD
jgi:hypothetical protein